MPRFANRIHSYGMAAKRWSLDPASTGYYGPDTLYRFIRPLALAELIERQMAYADFTVDEDAIGLLCFKRAAVLE